ncbi:MAG: hypothetical protein U0796_04090 [Gemmatales bacterium]
MSTLYRSVTDNNRHLWITEDNMATGLENSTLYNGSPIASHEALLEQFQQGNSLATLLKDATVIPLDRVEKIEKHITGNNIWLHLHNGKENELKSVYCKDEETKQQILQVLHQTLGESWKREVIEEPRWKAALLPLGCTLLFGFIAFCILMTALGHDKSSGSKTVRTNFIGAIIIGIWNLLGPIGALVAVLLLLMPCVVWLVWVLVKPPINDTIYQPKA